MARFPLRAFAASYGSRLSKRSITQSLAPLVHGFKPLEEPLHLSVDDGYGYAQIKPGDSIGPLDRFSVIRRLGWGMYSSTWLAKDHEDSKDIAIKVLTGFATKLAHDGLTPELDVLRKISSSPQGAEPKEGHCLSLRSDFLFDPEKFDTGPHLCLVTDAFGGDVEHLKHRCAGHNGFPLSLAKRILLHTLMGLATIHRQGIVHTDLKHDNILFDRGQTDSGNSDLPVSSVDDALDRTFVLGDFGNAQFVDKPTFDEITAEALRAPETILRGPWNEKVDIWTFGCLAFEFLCGRRLFQRRSYSEYLLDPVGSHLWRMQCFTNDKFDPELLNNSALRTQYFDDSCEFWIYSFPS
jgi:serine/threonine protein kinase